MDTSHAHVQGLDCAAAVRRFGTHICCTHISDNDGSGDQHRTPGGGSIDWPSVVAALRDVGYDGLFNLEIPGESEPPPEAGVLLERTREALAVATRLIGV